MDAIKDLSNSLARYLLATGTKDKPDETLLVKLFKTVFSASLEEDESQALRFDLVYIDPQNPDPAPPPYIRSPRWKFISLGSPLEFNVPSITKIALSTDKRTSLLAVYPDVSGELKIWGFIDQGANTYLFDRFESSGGWPHPGLFHVSVLGPGHISLNAKDGKIAELKGTELKPVSLRPFNKGPLPKSLAVAGNELYSLSKKYFSVYEFEEDVEEKGSFNYRSMLQQELERTLKRLLLRVQSFGHGGAFLVTPKTQHQDLNVKYVIEYQRLSEAIQKTAILIKHTSEINKELAHSYESKGKTIDKSVYLASSYTNSELEDAQEELAGSLWFASLLSKVDGLVLMDTSMTILGFGVEILTQEMPDKIWLAGDENGTKSKLKPLDYEHFGTRHRSMMRFIFSHPEAIGFVISQDGDVKVMLNVKGKLILWNNVQLTLQS